MNLKHYHISMIRTAGLLVLWLSLLLACEKTQEIQVGLLWKDDAFFSHSGSRYLGLLEGEYDLTTGFDMPVLDSTPVLTGINKSYLFSISASGSRNYTAFIFIDLDSSKTYDEGYDIISGYKYNYGEPGACLNISLSSFY